MTESLHEKLMLMLGEIRGELKGLNKRLDSMNGNITRNSKGIRVLEKADYYKKGVAATVSFIVALGVSLIGFFIKR